MFTLYWSLEEVFMHALLEYKTRKDTFSLTVPRLSELTKQEQCKRTKTQRFL